MKKIILGLLVLVVAAGATAMLWFNNQIGDTGVHKEPVVFEVPPGTTINGMAEMLEEEELIRNALAFKVYARIQNFSNLQAGHYQIKPGMDMRAIASTIFSGDVIFPDTITVTFPEGKTLDDMAAILAEKTSHTQEEILAVWDGEDFIQSAIDNYWFITEEVLNPDLKFALNGYLFPNTYNFENENVTPEAAAHRLLQEMDKVLTKYKDQIDSSEWTVHEILTMASIVEYEAIFDEDRPIVAGVFYNRLENNMRLQSCATLQMALGIHKPIYNSQDMAVNSPYNTYLVDGLPIGPGNSPGEPSIKAALNPESHNYFYFLSDIYNDSKTYYSETYEQHLQLQNELLR
ncbi:endolytic transglycosylase MltG [Alkalibacter rhizosphaerae]|uniref:Endolytic murein transglycosylase n=1 Tax=Alkalibacter rhizosphaerae TaxID=2815577 RepID=A0A975AHX0_9FIRM|nr:endolytic transglycosylase MltG [Alkalibacter rhizosphaerae]QSX07930.1 endolytic transglycosylase MltG [Alkalibacter rhizosphaerae]